MAGQCDCSYTRVCARVYPIKFRIDQIAKVQDVQKPEMLASVSNVKNTAGHASSEELSAQPGKRKPATADVASVSKKQKTKTSDEGFLIQSRACSEYSFLSNALCIACSKTSSGMRQRCRIRENCRFIGFRQIKQHEDSSCSVHFDGKCIPRAEREAFKFNEWEPPRTADHRDVVKVRLAYFLPFLCLTPFTV